ncbi:MAG: hypothetical protein IPM77_10470 [Crocinitomicaceae bacterium]|nr:hypothetical protein [Crocinitomicaceae bacterium]
MKNFLIVFLLFIGINSTAQNLYDIRWTSDGTEYYGFMVFFSEEDVYMRTGYYSADNAYNLVHSEYKYSIDESGDVITMVATSSEFVQNETNDTWDPDHLFWYKDETTQEFVGPYIISDSDLAAENYDNIIEPEFVEVDMAWINAEYLQFFYYTDEYDYSILLAAGQDYAEENSTETNVSTFQNENSTGSNNNQYNSSFSNGNSNSDSNGGNSNNGNTGNTTSNTNSTTNTNGNISGSSSIYGNLPVKVHLVVVANTIISDIGSSTLIDVNNIVGEITGITEVLGVELNKTLITDKQFTKKNVETFMYGFKPGLNDIVIFLYSGHGYRFSNQTEKYPQLDMRYSEYQAIDDGATMNLKQVFDEIVKKGRASEHCSW